MKARFSPIVLCLLPVLLLLPVASSASPGASYSVVKVPAPSLDGNLTSEESMQSLGVFLPPSYAEGTRRYPVLYFFTGYYGSFDIAFLSRQVDQLMAECEFIVVSINDINALHGAFGAKSPVVGDWNGFFLNDAIPAVDRQFRTIAAPEGRAVCGTSMGGHIALRLGFAHPEVFSIVYADSPGVFAPDGLEAAMPTWDRTFLEAYGAAYAPDLSLPYPHAGIPTMDDSPADLAIRAKWQNGFGHVAEMLDAYLARPGRLSRICVAVGTRDEYPWIPAGCLYLESLMNARGIPHTFILTEEGHEISPERFLNGMGRFVARAFADAEGGGK
jgi:pimeloyl-ACP methyl ester carboxylesterase